MRNMKQLIIPDKAQKEMLTDFMIMGETRGLIGGYCEDEFPVYYANEEIFSREHNTTTGKVGGTVFIVTQMHKIADEKYYS